MLNVCNPKPNSRANSSAWDTVTKHCRGKLGFSDSNNEPSKS